LTCFGEENYAAYVGALEKTMRRLP
jgi:hypothetical protein